jgi:hypothetical protein
MVGRREYRADERKAGLAAMRVAGQNQADRGWYCREYIGTMAQDDRNAAEPSQLLSDSVDVCMVGEVVIHAADGDVSDANRPIV